MAKRCKCDRDYLEDARHYGGLALSAGRALASFVGMGDYEIRSNSLVRGGGATTERLQIIPQGPRATRILYREYLGDVLTHPSTVGAFNLSSYLIHPANPAVFPWLVPIAQQFEQWTPNGIVFEFRSTSSEYVSATNLGSVIMATEYDALDADFTNKQDMLNSAYSSEYKPSTETIVHGIECDPRDTPNRIFYMPYATGLPSGSDPHDYVLGKFQIATQGSAAPAGTVLGSLYVNYDITLRKEQIYGGLRGMGILVDAWTGTTGWSNSFPMGTTQVANSQNSLGGTLTCASNLVKYTFPAWVTEGTWTIVLCLLPPTTPGAAATWNLPSDTVANMVLTTNAVGGSSFTGQTDYVNTNTNVVRYYCANYRVTGRGATWQITGPNFGGDVPTYSRFNVLQAPGSWV